MDVLPAMVIVFRSWKRNALGMLVMHDLLIAYAEVTACKACLKVGWATQHCALQELSKHCTQLLFFVAKRFCTNSTDSDQEWLD